MSAINVNEITGRTGLHGPVLTGVSSAADGFQVLAGEFKVNGISTFVGMSTFNGGIDVKGTGDFIVSGVSTFVGVATFGSGINITGGSVGIGTDGPNSLLEISGTGTNEAILTFNREPTAPNNGIIGELFFKNNQDSVALIAAKRQSAADDAYIQFATQSTGGGLSERMRITSDGNVGINSIVPRAKLSVANGTSNYNPGNPTGLGAGAVACFEDSDDVAIQFLTSTTTDNFIYFGDTDSATTGSIQYDHNVNSLIFNVNGGNQRLLIDQNGRVVIGNDSNYSASAGSRLAVELMTTAGTILEVADQTSGYSTLESVKNAGGTATSYGGFIFKGRRDSDDDVKEYLRITPEGEVNIGGDFAQTSYTMQISRIGGATDILRLKGDGGNAFIRFTDSDETADWTAGADDGSNEGSGAFAIYDRVNSAYRLTIDSSGNFFIYDGDLKFASGHGIDFSASGNAGGMTSELLDDYEIGTWTPNIGGNATYTSQSGTYVKVGRMVYATGIVTINNKGTGSTSGAILGLPFSSGAAAQNTSNLAWSGVNVNFAYGLYYVGNGGNSLSFSYTTGAQSGLTNNPDIWQNGASVTFSINYYASA